MKRTTKYDLGYFEEGDITLGSVEMQRWETLDAQLFSLFSVLGNGIINGWALTPSSGFSISIAPGQAHVNFVAVQTTENTILSGLVPNTTNYIYASITTDSYWTESVVFKAYISNNPTSPSLYIGSVLTNNVSVVSTNIDNRNNLGFLDLIKQLVAAHRHIGGDGNPTPINLATDVQGVLGQNSLPDIDASLVKTGTIAEARLPLIDHITHLVNQGTLTHAQLDSFVQALDIENSTLMGETSTIDLLQLILALKHVYPDIDEYLINELAYVPGISPNTLVDWDNTTAIVDTRPYSEGGEHKITGLSSPGQKNYTYTWDSESEFSSGTYENVVINGDYVDLDTQENKLVIDEFTDLSKWQVITDDLSSLSIALSSDPSTYIEPPASAKLVVGNSTVEIALIIKKEFDAQDWSGYSKFVFFLKTTSVQHGDIYFYLNDNFAGTQNSHTKVLDRNDPTVNIDTLQNGWQEITIDISSYTRNNINTIGFYVSSQKGWDTSKGFDLNLDNIYLTTGQEYYPNGYIRVIFGGNFLYDFWRLRWDAQIPTDSESAGLSLKGRTRVGNTLADLQQSMWSSYMTVSGTEISLPTSSFYKYIQIEMYFQSSTNLNRTPSLRSIYLDFYASDIDNSFNYETKNDWDSGTKINIDTNTVSNSMLIYGTADIGDFIYGSEEVISIRNKNLNELYRITSSMLPRSTYQILNDLPSSLGLITGVARGNYDGIWFCDTDNDRVLEVDRSGGLIRGFFGSYLVENQSESNVSSTTTTTTVANTTVATSNISILQTIYNSSKGILYIIFNRDLTLAELANISDKLIKVGANNLYLSDALTTILDGFKHAYQVTITGANLTVLNRAVNTLAPSILILNPYEQQRIQNNSTTVKFLIYNFALGTKSGENGIRVTLDGTNVQNIYKTSINYTGLSSGTHTIKAQLLNANGTLNTNIEAIAEGTFVVYSGTYSLPYISVSSPKPNQISSAPPVQIEFNVENFPILSTGQHLRYSVDGNAPIDYYSENPILIENLSAGKHRVRLYLVDKRGNEIAGYTYGSVTVEFVVGLNSKASAKFYCTYSGTFLNSNVIVANLLFTDVYAPFDVQYIPSEVSLLNPSGQESVLIAKLTNNDVLSKIGT